MRTRRDFHAAVVSDGFAVSYEAVRNYHHDRTPPIDYLVRVADRFGYRLEWLATGRGSPYAEPSQLEGRRERGEFDGFEFFEPEGSIHAISIEFLRSRYLSDWNWPAFYRCVTQLSTLAEAVWASKNGLRRGVMTDDEWKEAQDLVANLVISAEAPLRWMSGALGQTVLDAFDYHTLGIVLEAMYLHFVRSPRTEAYKTYEVIDRGEFPQLASDFIGQFDLPKRG